MPSIAIGPASVTLATGEEIGSDFTLTVTGARPQAWLADTGLAAPKMAAALFQGFPGTSGETIEVK